MKAQIDLDVLKRIEKWDCGDPDCGKVVPVSSGGGPVPVRGQAYCEDHAAISEAIVNAVMDEHDYPEPPDFEEPIDDPRTCNVCGEPAESIEDTICGCGGVFE